MNDVPKLGQLIDSNEQRDAIHIAVAPVEAAEKVYPGNWVEWEVHGRPDKVVACHAGRGIGIVDPFLPAGVPVLEGQHFWMFLKPGTITGLRHEWEHPAFSNMQGTAEFWLRDFAHTYDMNYDELMAQVYHQAESFAFGEDINYPPDAVVEEFRKHIKIATGVTLGKDVHFRCAC